MIDQFAALIIPDSFHDNGFDKSYKRVIYYLSIIGHIRRKLI